MWLKIVKNMGRTALYVAALRGQVESAHYLLLRGADVNARDALEGRTPLMIALSLGDLPFFSAYFTAPWERFWTASLCNVDTVSVSHSGTVDLLAWYRASQAQRPVVKLLLEAGADVSVKDIHGRDALDYVAVGGLTDFDQLIRRSNRIEKQATCDLTLVQSPGLRGFHLGMSLHEVLSKFRSFPSSSTDSCGRLALDFIKPTRGALTGLAINRQDFAGVNRLQMTFLDERLAYIRITYNAENTFKNMDQYRATLSTSLTLPGRWRVAASGNNWDQAHVVDCDGFKVIAGYMQGMYVEMHDLAALNKLLERKVAAEEKQRREMEQERQKRQKAFRP